MSNRIYDASHLTKRKGQQATAGSFLTRLQPPNPSTPPQVGAGPLNGIYDSSIMNEVAAGSSTQFTRYPTCIGISQGCPCPDGQYVPYPPSAVTNIRFTVGSVIVSWDPPARGDGPFTYQIIPYLYGVEQPHAISDNVTSYRFTNLQEGEPYTFEVFAYNPGGTGPRAQSPTHFIVPPARLSEIHSGDIGGSANLGGYLVDNLISPSIEKSLKYIINHGLNSVLEYASKVNWGPTKCSRNIYLWAASLAQAWNRVRPESIITGTKDNWNWSAKATTTLTDEEAVIWLTCVIDVITPILIGNAHKFIYNISPSAEAAVKAKAGWSTWYSNWQSWFNERANDGNIAAAAQPENSANWSQCLFVDGTTVNPIASYPEPQQWTRLYIQGKKQNYLTHGWGTVESSCLTALNDADVEAAVQPAVGAARDAEIDDVKNRTAALVDSQKIQAEFWAGGPGTVSPPLMFIWFWKEYMRVLSNTSYTTIIYSLFDLAVHLFEAGRMCWKLKARYMEARPIQEIRRRYQGQQILSWNGMIDGAQWVPYQEVGFVTPPFADFPSGHSQFSKSFALTMARWFGPSISKLNTFYDGLPLIAPLFKEMQRRSFGDFVVSSGSSTIQATVPAAPLTLSYAAWEDMATAAGISRLYGGIHAITAHTASQTAAGLIDGFINSYWWNNQSSSSPPTQTSTTTSPPTSAPAAAFNPPTLVYGLPSNNSAYIYFTPGTSGTPVNYEYTIDNGNTFTALIPSDILSPIYIPGLTNDNESIIKLRAINSSNDKSEWSAAVSVTPNNPSIPAAQLIYDANITASYNGGASVNSIGAGTMTGTKVATVGYVDGQNINRKVFDFNGFGYISFGQYDFGDLFTISAWVYPRDKTSINGILANIGANANTVGFKVGWNGWQNNNKNMLFEAGGPAPGSWGTPRSENNTVTLDTWQYLSYVFDKVNRRILFYRNGMPVNTANIQTGVDIDTNNPIFLIGAYVGGSYGMNAQLGLIKIYNTALNAAQVLADYNSTKSDFDTSPALAPGGITPASVPEPTPAVPEPTPSVPEPTPSVPEPTPAVPEPTPSVPEPTPSVPEPTPSVPEPTPSVPEPTPSVPEPTPSVPEPTPSVPEPTPSVPEPTPSVPEPTPSVPEPTPAVPEPIPEPAPSAPTVTPYSIQINYVSSIPTPEIQALITTSKEFIENIIQESHGMRLAEISLSHDMVVDLDVKPLADNILASARPTYVNTSVSPARPLRQSVILNSNRFNSSSLLAPVEFNGISVAKLVPVMIHEMMHGLGIASLDTGYITVGWDQFLDSSKTWYAGSGGDWMRSEAIKAYRELVGTQVARIPVENSFGQGTAYSHWEEGITDGFVKEPRYYNYGGGNVFHPALPEEIMTGLAGNRFYFTKVTAGALADHGYKVNMNSPNIVPYPPNLVQTP
jgi:hypothetical protein